MKQLAADNQSMLSGENAAYYVINATIQVIFCGDEMNRRNMFYLACKECKKKVSDSGNGYYCERCEKNY
jgi:hypothetical protein